MLPGKKYQPDDLVRIVWRYRWLVIIPAFVMMGLGVVVARKLPNQYRSETLVMVVPSRIPEAYVRTTITQRVLDRVLSIREQILSRSRLERVMDELALYQDERQTESMEDLIDTMRANVTTRVVREDGTFSISFVSQDPNVAQKVTERLAGLFSEENMRDREMLAESTNQFLETQLDEARQRLTEHEQRVEEFRRQYAGQLPDQVPSNLQAIQNAELQVQTLLQSLNSDRERRLLLERQLADAQVLDMPSVGVTTPANTPLSPMQQLEAAESHVRELQTRLTSLHPDLVQARAVVERVRSQVAAQRAGTPAAEGVQLSAAETLQRTRLGELRNQLETVDRQIGQKTDEEHRLRAVITSYRGRVEAAPSRETELVSLTRDYDTLQHRYRGLLEKYEESKVAANLERRQIGVQFRVVDPARVPERPFTPNRPVIVAASFGGGLVLGLALAFLLELSDKTLRAASDVTLCLGVPVLAVIPMLAPTSEPRGRFRFRWPTPRGGRRPSSRLGGVRWLAKGFSALPGLTGAAWKTR